MSSVQLTPHNIATINRLVLEVRKYGPKQDLPREDATALMAGLRLLKGKLSEGELRAVIYDSMCSHARRGMRGKYAAHGQPQ